MEYSSYQYLYPPRPEHIVPRGAIGFYQKQGYWAQVKKNGTNTVIFTKGKEVIFKTRHDDNHRQWSPLPEHIRFFESLNPDAWNVFCAELIHSKTPHIKNQLYIYDQIVEDGVHLVGTRFEDRTMNLLSHWNGSFEKDQLRVTDHVSVAMNFTGDFDKLWDTLQPEDEGLVLKNPNGRLKVCHKANANAGWQVKSRVPHKNYSF